MKTLSGIFIIGFFIRLLRPQASNLIGPAGPGFIINTFLFGLWLATPWFWLKLISNILIASILIANYKMIKNES
jgi:hypothetical protein